MKNFFDNLGSFCLDFLPGIVIISAIVGFIWFFAGFLIPDSDHRNWQTRVDFCASAGGYYTNERFGDLTVCRSLRDHSVFYVDTNTGARYTITTIGR